MSTDTIQFAMIAIMGLALLWNIYYTFTILQKIFATLREESKEVN